MQRSRIPRAFLGYLFLGGKRYFTPCCAGFVLADKVLLSKLILYTCPAVFRQIAIRFNRRSRSNCLAHALTKHTCVAIILLILPSLRCLYTLVFDIVQPTCIRPPFMHRFQIYESPANSLRILRSSETAPRMYELSGEGEH